jgi:hypothetical protein
MFTDFQHMPDKASFLTENAGHLSGVGPVLYNLHKVNGFLMETLVSQDSVQGIVVCREPRRFQYCVQALAVVIRKYLGKLIVQFLGDWQLSRWNLGGIMITDRE